MKHSSSILWLCLLALATACSSPAEKPPYSGIKLGQEYEVNGRWYKPHYESGYDEIGTASWYGPGFHGGKTANGERFNENDLTAAHRTLPLPCIVRVTNLDNGKSALIRINDRGPFAHDRIIDLSKAAATKLGVIRTGTARVRVQFLERETRQYVQNMQQGTQYAMDSLKHMDTAAVEPIIMQQPAAGLPWQQGQNNAQRMEGEPLAPEQPSEPQADIFSVVDSPGASPARPQYVSYKPAPQMDGFFIQAGTFSVQANADKRVDALASVGTTSVVEVMNNGRKFYRVLMGPYNMRSDAKNMLSKLASIGIPDAKIIHN